jgi:hypothetical protein
MMRTQRAALWGAPLLLYLAIYWPGLAAWFQRDDFGWLNLAYNVERGKPLLEALFEPQAQGTFRVLSERALFLLSYRFFGLDALPCRLLVFATQFGNLILLHAIVRRLTGSAVAGFWTCVFWIVSVGLALPMVWTAVYNQVLCAFFVLLAFWSLLNYAKTGRRRYLALQWAAFLAGFAALEIIVVYPALAAAWTWVFARRRFAGTLPMFAISGVYTAVNRYFAPAAEGLYQLQFDAGVFLTLGQYWAWATGAGALHNVYEISWKYALPGVAAVTTGLLWFVARRSQAKDWLPAFCLLWFFILLAPYAPIQRHVSDYYLTLPSVGLAMLGGYAMVGAPRVVALPLAALYVTTAAACTMNAVWFYASSSWRARDLVAGVARAAQLHGRKPIVLADVDAELFWAGVLDNPFRLAGAHKVYLAPGAERRIPALEGIGDPSIWVLPEAALARGLATDSVVIYSAAGRRLRNVTSVYEPPAVTGTPRRVDAGNPLLAYLLGDGWYEAGAEGRWMGKAASLRIGGPGATLSLEGRSPQACELTVAVDGARLPARRIEPGDVNLQYALPPELRTREALAVRLEVSRTVRPPEDGRELGLLFGVLEIR